MASGDTKTEQMLNVLANGGDASQLSGCCNTKTQNYILGAIDRIQSVEDDVEELKNNPDVVDIVDTYADLQAYDTQHLTENDIIRVLQDETHSGNSTYYRFTKNPDTWTFIGEVSGGGGEAVKTLTTADYNYPVSNPDSISFLLLDEGFYKVEENAYARILNNTKRMYLNTSFFYVGDEDSNGNKYFWEFCTKNSLDSESIYPINIYVGNPNTGAISTSSTNHLVTAGYLKKNISAIQQSSAPTTSTKGEVGQICIDTTNGEAYICISALGVTYTWKQITNS